MAPDLETSEFEAAVRVICRGVIVPRTRLNFLCSPVDEGAFLRLAKLDESCLIDEQVSFGVELGPSGSFDIDTSFHYLGLFYDGVLAVNVLIKPL